MDVIGWLGTIWRWLGEDVEAVVYVLGPLGEVYFLDPELMVHRWEQRR